MPGSDSDKRRRDRVRHQRRVEDRSPWRLHASGVASVAGPHGEACRRRPPQGRRRAPKNVALRHPARRTQRPASRYARAAKGAERVAAGLCGNAQRQTRAGRRLCPVAGKSARREGSGPLAARAPGLPMAQIAESQTPKLTRQRQAASKQRRAADSVSLRLCPPVRRGELRALLENTD